jgi:hypothetical protein
MKKFKSIGMLVLAFASVILMTGCATHSGITQIPDTDSSFSGEWPEAGDVIVVNWSRGFETTGPYAQVYAWRKVLAFSDDGGLPTVSQEVKTLVIYGSCDNGLRSHLEGDNFYSVVRLEGMKGLPYGLAFTPIK